MRSSDWMIRERHIKIHENYSKLPLISVHDCSNLSKMGRNFRSPVISSVVGRCLIGTVILGVGVIALDPRKTAHIRLVLAVLVVVIEKQKHRIL